MGVAVNVVREGIKNYIGLTDNPFLKVLALEKKLSLHRFSFESAYKSQIIFFDTETNLLEKAGIILSKVVEPEKSYFKVERQTYLPRSFSQRKEVVFIHEVGPRDKVSDHSFFLVDGIISLFTTQFTIDLENVLKNALPKIVIMSKIKKLKVLSGGGFKGTVYFKDSKVKNLVTKRSADMKLLTVELNSSLTYLSSFNFFNEQIEKYCKELVPFNEHIYDYVKRITKPIQPKAKLTKEEKKKLKEKNVKTDDEIIG